MLGSRRHSSLHNRRQSEDRFTKKGLNVECFVDLKFCTDKHDRRQANFRPTEDAKPSQREEEEVGYGGLTSGVSRFGGVLGEVGDSPWFAMVQARMICRWVNPLLIRSPAFILSVGSKVYSTIGARWINLVEAYSSV